MIEGYIIVMSVSDYKPEFNVCVLYSKCVDENGKADLFPIKLFTGENSDAEIVNYMKYPDKLINVLIRYGY